MPDLMGQLDAHPTDDQDIVVGLPSGRQHSIVEIDYEIFSKVILSLLLILEGQFSVSVERMCTMLVAP